MERCNWRVNRGQFRSMQLINPRFSLPLSPSSFPILLPMRLLIPVAAPCEFQRAAEENQWHPVRFADTKRDVPGRGHWFSKSTTYKYRLVANPPLLLLLLRHLLSSSPLLLLPSLARDVYLDNLPLGGSGTRCAKGASSSRWLLSRWHRVPRLWIGDCLLSPR